VQKPEIPVILELNGGIKVSPLQQLKGSGTAIGIAPPSLTQEEVTLPVITVLNQSKRLKAETEDIKSTATNTVTKITNTLLGIMVVMLLNIVLYLNI
jgi:hypothetical protein